MNVSFDRPGESAQAGETVEGRAVRGSLRLDGASMVGDRPLDSQIRSIRTLGTQVPAIPAFGANNNLTPYGRLNGQIQAGTLTENNASSITVSMPSTTIEDVN